MKRGSLTVIVGALVSCDFVVKLAIGTLYTGVPELLWCDNFRKKKLTESTSLIPNLKPCGTLYKISVKNLVIKFN